MHKCSVSLKVTPWILYSSIELIRTTCRESFHSVGPGSGQGYYLTPIADGVTCRPSANQCLEHVDGQYILQIHVEGEEVLR